MSEVEGLFRDMNRTELQTLLELCELRRIDLNNEIDSQATTPQRRVEAIKQRSDVMIQWAETMTKLASTSL
jgi:hypothetical protein